MNLKTIQTDKTTYKQYPKTNQYTAFQCIQKDTNVEKIMLGIFERKNDALILHIFNLLKKCDHVCLSATIQQHLAQKLKWHFFAGSENW